MICKHCGGQIEEGRKYCGFCQNEVDATLSEEEKKQKHIEECLGISHEPEQQVTWWEESCGEENGCGHGLTSTNKDLKYALTLVGLVAGVILLTLAGKTLVELFF